MLNKIPFSAGVIKDDTPLSSEGAYVDADKVRFVVVGGQSKPQVIGGWEALTTSTISGVCRGLHVWADNDGAPQIGLGTHTHLFAYSGGGLYDITPVASTGTLGSNPFTTASGSATVSVAHTSHGRSIGDRVKFSGAAAVNGVTISGEYTVATVPSANAYTVTHSAAASGSGAGGGASVAFTYYLPSGNADGTGGAGYGSGAYGVGTWGTTSNVAYYPRTWTLDNWGEHLVACPRGGGIYEWSLNTSSPAALVAGAPATAQGVFVSAERILVAYGAHDGTADDPLNVRWTDQEQITVWTPSASNLAGDFRLSGGSRIVRGLASRGQNLLWTDVGLHSMRFNGDPQLVYSFALLGQGCGLIGPNAVVEFNGAAYWLSNNGQFYAYTGGVPERIPCTLRRDVMENLALVQADKVYAFTNAAFSEIWWLYPDSRDGNECSRYVAVSLSDGSWTCGTFDRTAWMDAGVLQYPVAVGGDGAIYYQERLHSANGGVLAAFLETAPLDIADGDQLMHVAAIVPDFEDLEGAVALTLTSQLYPNGAETTHAAQTVTASTTKLDARVTARQVALRLDSSAAPSFWRLGALRLDLRQTGARR
jgi:hypothetical protein